MIAINEMGNLICPNCGNHEMHPDGKHCLIKAFKVQMDDGWHSQCLVCSGYYDTSLNETPENHQRNKGWFV